MRFLFIIDALDTGGAERMVLSLSEALLRQGHEVDLLVIKNTISLEVPKDVRLHVLNYKKMVFFPYNLLYAFLLRRCIFSLEAENGGFDVISSNLNLSYRLSNIAKLKNVYYCIHEAVSVSSLARRRGLKRFFRKLRFQRILNGKNIITVSNGIKNDLLNIVKVEPASIKVIYNGVDFSRIFSMAEREECDFKFDYVIHVGRLNRQKRHDILLKAYKKSNISCKLVLVGEGAERSNIEKEILKLGLSSQVVMVGNMENPYPVIKNSLLMLLSSDYEGLPTVLLESFVLSTPVVSVDCYYGPREILGKKYVKYLAKPGDVDDLSEKISIAFEDVNNEKLTVSPDYITRFDINNIAKNYVSLARCIN